MQADTALREHIINLLNGGQAFAPFDEIVKYFPEKDMNTVFPNGTYTPWHLLEHIRRTQFDILNFIVNPKYVEPEWPKDYWPATDKKASKKDWEETITRFTQDREALKKLVLDPTVDMFAKVPNGDSQTYLREFLLVADHNAYHLGEFSIMRQVMGTWGENLNR